MHGHKRHYPERFKGVDEDAFAYAVSDGPAKSKGNDAAKKNGKVHVGKSGDADERRLDPDVARLVDDIGRFADAREGVSTEKRMAQRDALVERAKKVFADDPVGGEAFAQRIARAHDGAFKDRDFERLLKAGSDPERKRRREELDAVRSIKSDEARERHLRDAWNSSKEFRELNADEVREMSQAQVDWLVRQEELEKGKENDKERRRLKPPVEKRSEKAPKSSINNPDLSDKSNPPAVGPDINTTAINLLMRYLGSEDSPGQSLKTAEDIREGLEKFLKDPTNWIDMTPPDDPPGGGYGGVPALLPPMKPGRFPVLIPPMGGRRKRRR